MQKPVQISITVFGVNFDSDDRTAIAAKFLSAAESVAASLAAGTDRVPIIFVVGKKDEVEPYCRVCGKHQDELPAGITLQDWNPTGGIRPLMELSKPSEITQHYCGCLERSAQRKEQLDRAALNALTPIAPPYLPSTSQAELERQLADLKAAIARLENH